MPATVNQPRRHGFTLIELLVVISIIGIMIGLLLPVLSSVRKEATKITCGSNMRQVGIAFQAYRTDNKEFMPAARYMPEPFLSADTDPPIYEALSDQLPTDGDNSNDIWHCPADDIVFDLSGSSYDYLSLLSGERVEDLFFIRLGLINETELIISRDFDNSSADVSTQPDPLAIPPRHLRRNNLWADGHVSVIDIE